METPDKIFLSVEKGEDWTHAMWTQKNPEEQKFRELDEHEEYIRKDAILEWAEKKIVKGTIDEWDKGYVQCLNDLIDKLNSM